MLTTSNLYIKFCSHFSNKMYAHFIGGNINLKNMLWLFVKKSRKERNQIKKPISNLDINDEGLS